MILCSVGYYDLCIVGLLSMVVSKELL